MIEECEVGNCGSRDLHVGQDGYIYCSEGHRQEQTGLITAAEDGIVPAGRRSTRTGVRTAQEVITGQRGVSHYLLCFQLVLRKQTHALVHDLGLPDELKDVVHDIWLLRLTVLQDKLKGDGPQNDESKQMYGSQHSENETEPEGSPKAQRLAAIPRVLDGVGIIFTAIALLQVPMGIATLHNLISSGRLPFYHTSKMLSPGMKSRLFGTYHNLLDPPFELSLSQLQKTISLHLAEAEHTFGLVIPPFNHVLYLFQVLRSLALPIELFNGALCLARHLKMDFKYQTSEVKPYSTDSRHLPEHRLISLMIATAKLFFPFDKHNRPPGRVTEPAAYSIDWQEWVEIMAGHNSIDQRDQFSTALGTREGDVIHASESAMDQYMEWFQDTFLDKENEPKGRLDEDNYVGVLHRLFPLEDRNDTARQRGEISDGRPSEVQRMRASQSRIRPARVVPKTSTHESIDRPGSMYRRHRRAEELSGIIREFYNRVSKVTGFTVDSLVRGTFAVEQLMEQHM